MLVQAGLCRTCSETTLLVFPQGGSIRFCYTMFDFIQVHKESETETLKCRVLFTFYATTLISVIDSCNVSEQFMSVILPHLSRGMKSSVAEYKAASYMILAQLLHSAKLNPDILKTIQQIIAKVMCLVCNFERRKYTLRKCLECYYT